MKITSQDKAVLSAIQFNAHASANQIAKISGLKVHVVHYHLRRLKDEGIIRPGAFVNLSALGLEQYEILFSLSSETTKKRQAISQYFGSHNKVFWFAELGGNYQYGVSLGVRRSREVPEVFKEIAEKFGKVIQKKAVSLLTNVTLFKKKYLTDERGINAQSMLQENASKLDFRTDAIDYKILACLFDPAVESNHDMSRKTGIARATIEYRLKKLEQSNLIQAYIYYISARKLGLQTFKLLLYARGADPAFAAKLLNFCLKHKNVVSFIECLGNWDFEVTVEVLENKEMIELISLFYDNFGQYLTDIEVLTVFDQTTSKNLFSYSG